MNYPAEVQQVLVKYGVLMPDGSPGCVFNKRVNCGVLMDSKVVERLVGVDTTPDNEWLDWIFFQAGGGAKAQTETARVQARLKDKFFTTHTKGNEKLGIAAASQDQVEAMWAKQGKALMASLAVLGEPFLREHVYSGCFGYYRNWPGRANIYPEVVATVKAWLEIKPRVIEMNRKNPDSAIDISPHAYGTVESLRKAVGNFGRAVYAGEIEYIGKPEHDDLVYSDQNLKVMIPATWATAVKYGFSSHDISNPERYKAALKYDGTPGPWQSRTQQSLWSIWIFDVPMPVAKDKTSMYDHLLLEIPIADALASSFDENYDFIARTGETIDLHKLKQLVRDEVTRPDVENTHDPIVQGARTIRTDAEANAIIASIESAYEALLEWLKHDTASKLKRIIRNPFRDVDFNSELR